MPGIGGQRRALHRGDAGHVCQGRGGEQAQGDGEGCIDTWCHGWGKKKALPKWGFQPRCPLSCELGLLHPQEQTFLTVSPMVRL